MEKQLARELIEFIHQSPTNFHAVANASRMLAAHGFHQLSQGEAWHIEKGGKYFVTQNQSLLFAFEAGTGEVADGMKKSMAGLSSTRGSTARSPWPAG